VEGKFAGSEVVEFGVQIEINGRDFYRTLVEKSKNEKAKELFEFLESEEEKHIKRFRDILKSLQNYKPKEAYPEEYFSYMNSLAGEYVFTKKGKGLEIASKVKSDKEALDLGIGFEKDSIVFYEGMKKIVSDSNKSILDKLIEEENNHLKKLTGLKGEI